jgi:hypothetical protein
MDAIKLLKQDHRDVEELFEKFEKAKADSQKEKLATQICQMLKVHAAIEEELFYPAAKAEMEEEDLIDEAQVEHNSAKQLIAEIEQGPGEELWEAKVKVLGEYIKHHVKEEEGEIFKEVRATDIDLEELGQSMMARKEELMRDMGMDGKSASKSRSKASCLTLLRRNAEDGCRASLNGEALRISVPAVGQQDLAFALVIGLRDHSFFFHLFDQARGAVIADLQAALDIGGRYFPIPRDDRDRLVEQIIAAVAATA